MSALAMNHEHAAIWYNQGDVKQWPGDVPASRAVTQEVSAPMCPKYTEPAPTSEYTRITVPTAGALTGLADSVEVLVDSRFAAELQRLPWQANQNGKKAYVTCSVAGSKMGIGIVVWRIANNKHPDRIYFANKDTLDARLENLVLNGSEREIRQDDDTVHLSGHDRARHAHIDVGADLQAGADIELKRREKDSQLLGRGKSRAQYRRRKTGVSAGMHQTILDRDGGICFYCEYEADQVDHIIPYAHGGTDDERNLVACCSICNMIASDKVFNTLEQKRDFVRDQYGPWMKKRYRRLLRKVSVCADCRKVYNPQQKGATVVLCKDCYRADELGLNGSLT